MPLQATSGAASYDAFGGGVPFVPTYIEDVMSVWLYTGNDSTQPITNGIDLAGKGGAVFIKKRAANFGANSGTAVLSTALGNNVLLTHVTNALQSYPGTFIFGSSGFNPNTSWTTTNQEGDTYASWTFRKQPKFFDVVTYTGNGVNGRQISHTLGSVPGCIIVKRTDTTANWAVYHRSNDSGGSDPQNYALYLNTTDGQFGAGFWNNTAPTATVFTVANDSRVNADGGTYVAYVLAHNAGGFGLTGTDNVISCGSWTGNGAEFGPLVNLGYEPQWILLKNVDSGTENWIVIDNMRGMAVELGTEDSGDLLLFPNTSGAEINRGRIRPEATGFTPRNFLNVSSNKYIYIAIRRGPMKVPTDGTSVFSPIAYTGNGTTQVLTTGVNTDLGWFKQRNGTRWPTLIDKLRGGSAALYSNSTLQEEIFARLLFGNTTVTSYNNDAEINGSGNTMVGWTMTRAPGFFDEVCYTGTGSARTVAHNLTVVPEMMIVKVRSSSNNWAVYHKDLGNTKYLNLDSTAAADTFPLWNDTTPTASVFSLGTNSTVNSFAGSTYVWYGFATCPGVSKVGSFTGTGATQVIDCGFTGGARFVLIKATSTTGNWLVWDSARGIVSGNDPYLALNSTAAEVTNTDWVDTAASGFELSNAGGNLANSSGVSYVFLAIS
jgi:hypothetical protein